MTVAARHPLAMHLQFASVSATLGYDLQLSLIFAHRIHQNQALLRHAQKPVSQFERCSVGQAGTA